LPNVLNTVRRPPSKFNAKGKTSKYRDKILNKGDMPVSAFRGAGEYFR